MKSVIIYLQTPQRVKEFVNTITKFECDADIRNGRYVINAKSILGIFSLDLKTPLVLEIISGATDDLIQEIIPFTKKQDI